MTKKYPENLHTQKIFNFLKTLKNIEILNFEPPKMAKAYVYMKISEYGGVHLCTEIINELLIWYTSVFTFEHCEIFCSKENFTFSPASCQGCGMY